ncbi:mitochondrial carrier [Dacryopinax primogenitus]|uniref:Mitochondrial carrier n=1 Tax=Dacryopinax primogenitus (strain DJM 731) TaxID=1858805 RepID=M5G5D2_DACPD|nr:mitochondrial carrier [Dacryopinax primogenitus]EJU03889.1 mitochondrial carrier [Dacryopinax primogenitus]
MSELPAPPAFGHTDVTQSLSQPDPHVSQHRSKGWLASYSPELRAWINESIAGTVGGAVGMIVSYPFDTVRVRLQNPDTAHKYRGMMHAFTLIVKEEKVTGLFKGMTSPLITLAPLNGLVFGAYGYLLRLQYPNLTPEERPPLLPIALAGTLAGVLGSTIAGPVELVKIRQQNLVGAQGMPSTLSVVRDIWRKRGPLGLYRGFTSTALRDSGGGPYFLTYEILHRLNPHSPFTPLIAGGAAGIVGWLSTFPFDVIKTRMQSVDRAEAGKYKTTWSTIRACWREEGWRVFWTGVRPAMIECLPYNMATFGAFELVLHFLR